MYVLRSDSSAAEVDTFTRKGLRNSPNACTRTMALVSLTSTS